MQMGQPQGETKIAVDAMGADMGTAEVVRAAAMALERFDDIDGIVLVGKRKLLERLLKVAKLSNESRISICPATQVVGMEEKPIQSLKRKIDASMFRAIELVKEGSCQAAVSCGNTGSLVACSTIKLRPLKGIERAAIAEPMPSKDQHFVLIDAGANPTAKPNHLVHNAILGKHYARVILGKSNPRIGLLSNGTEEGKGNELTLAAHSLLKRITAIVDYRGLIEGLDVFSNKVDVIVCDGFTGNVVLKSCESLVLSMKDFLKEEVNKNPIRLTGALLSKGVYRNLNEQLNPDQYGGAPLLGLGGHVLKAHGSSNKFAIMNAIRAAKKIADTDMNVLILQEIEQANKLIREEELDTLPT